MKISAFVSCFSALILFCYSYLLSLPITVSQSFSRTRNEDISEAATLVGWYKLTYHPDSTAPSVQRTETMRLLIGNKLSRFESKGSYLKDSIHTSFSQKLEANQDVGQQYVTSMTSVARSNFRYIIMKNNAKITHYDRILTDPTIYRIQDAKEVVKWNITSEKKEMLGYACQRAQCSFSGRRYEAWFTREIPVAEGPYKFRGLPGLIVAVWDTKKDYVFELTKLVKPKQNISITQPNKFINTSREDFKKGQANYMQSLPQTISAMKTGRSAEQNQETVQAIKSKVSKMNNSLELK